MPSQIRSYEKARLRKIAALCKEGSILDIGYAHMPNPFYSSRSRTGVDLESPHYPSGYEEELIGNALDLPNIVNGRKFDNIVAGEIIEHLENPYEFVRILKSCLKKDGRLILSTPNPLAWPVIFFEAINSHRFYYTQNHLYYFPPRWVDRILNKCGFQSVQKVPVGFWLPGVTLPCPTAMSYQVIFVADNN